MKKYLSEGLAVFLFIIINVAAYVFVQDQLLVTAVIALGLAFLVMVFQHISGAHINPALTLGHIVTKKIKPLTGLFYIIAQFAGGALATIILARLDLIGSGTTTSTWLSFWAEVVGTFIFALGVAAAAFHKVESSKVSTVVGTSLFFGVFMSVVLFKTPVVLNPAVAFGMSVVSLSILIGPFIGAALAFLVYWFLTECKVLDMLSWENMKKTNSEAPTEVKAHHHDSSMSM